MFFFLSLFISFVVVVVMTTRSALRMLGDRARQDGAEVFRQSRGHSSRTITSGGGRVSKTSAKEIMKRGRGGVGGADVIPAEMTICFGEQMALCTVCLCAAKM